MYYIMPALFVYADGVDRESVSAAHWTLHPFAGLFDAAVSDCPIGLTFLSFYNYIVDHKIAVFITQNLIICKY